MTGKNSMAETAIIIPVYATAENSRCSFLQQTLRSVARQNYVDFTCLVVDDGSPDKGVEDIVNGYAQADQRFRYLYRERKPTDKVTASNARNRGLEEMLNPEGILAGTEFVTFLDSDDLLPRKSLEARVDYLKQHQDAGAVYSDFLLFKGNSPVRYSKASSAKGEKLLREEIEYVAFSPLTLMWRRTLIEMINELRALNGNCRVFNPEITFGEDRDVAISTLKTALQVPYSIGYVRQPLRYYRNHPHSVVNTTPIEIKKADIVITSTSAPHYVIHADQVKEAIKHRRGNPMFLIDIAVPRDIEPDVANIDNVYLYNIDDLQSVVSQNIDERNREVEKCRVLIEEEVEHFMARLEEMKIEPAITHLRNHFHTIGKEELDRLKPKLKNVDNGDWEQVIYTMERTINKLLHHPAKVAKQEAKNGGGYRYVETIKKLFGIFHHTDNP